MKIKNASWQLWMQRRQRQKRRESHAKTNQPMTNPPTGTQTIVPRGIETHPSFSERWLPTTMSTATKTTKNRVKLHKGHSEKYTPPTPALPAGRQIILPRGITTYQYFPNRKLPKTMSATYMTTNKRWKLHKWHSTHARSSFREADDSAQRDYDQPIHYQKVITHDYDRGDNNNK